MARLTIRLLGPVQIALDGNPITHFESEKARALLAYLAAQPDRPHRREVLAEMLWPGRPEGGARANLRHTLACLRKVLGDHTARPPFFLPSRHTLRFNEASDSWIDVVTFSALLPDRPAHPQTLRQLEAAVQLCRGPFLEDLSLADSATFEEWRVLCREHYGHLLLDALWRLVVAYERCGDYGRALALARRELELEPWDEAAQRQMMRLLALTGRRAEALAHYESFRRLLAEELSAEPATATIRLYRQIRNGEWETPAELPIMVGGAGSTPQRPGFF